LGDLHRRYLDLLGALKKEKQGEKLDKNKVWTANQRQVRSNFTHNPLQKITLVP
jgi:hypothetical protein